MLSKNRGSAAAFAAMSVRVVFMCCYQLLSHKHRHNVLVVKVMIILLRKATAKVSSAKLC